MKSLLLDKAAIGLSAACVVHCLTLPVALVLIPSLAVLPFGDESFHLWMIFLVVPTSLVALSMGCRKHGNWDVMLWGGAGLFVMLAAVVLGHDLLGEMLEKAVTVVGATLVVVGHMKNFRRCQEADCEH